MKIKIIEDLTINHYEMFLSVHPKNKDAAKIVLDKIEMNTYNLIGLDEYRNRYPISILSVYYVEQVDQKVFIYTNKDVYRVFEKLTVLKEKLKPYGFYQINVRTLVNSHYVEKFTYKKECHREIYMNNEEILISNRKYRDECDQMIKEMNIARYRPGKEK